MSIEDKLRDILNNFHGDPDFLEANVEAVKNAFIEEGYVQMAYNPVKRELLGKPIGNVLSTNDVMTGQEFYDRFEREYHMRADWISADPIMGDDAEHDVLLAARLAAGLDK